MLTNKQLLNVYLTAYTKKEASFYKPLQDVLGLYKKKPLAYRFIKAYPDSIYDLHSAGHINDKQFDFLYAVQHIFKAMAQKGKRKTVNVFRYGNDLYPVDIRTVFRSAITGKPLYTKEFPPTSTSISVKER